MIWKTIHSYLTSICCEIKYSTVEFCFYIFWIFLIGIHLSLLAYVDLLSFLNPPKFCQTYILKYFKCCLRDIICNFLILCTFAQSGGSWMCLSILVQVSMEVTYTEHKSTFKNDVIQFLVYNISWGGIVFFSSKSKYKFGLSHVCLFVCIQ